MAESKHKVGDKVLIKDVDWYEKNTIIDTEGFFRTSVRLLCPVMLKYLDTICTVSAVLGDGEYLLAETGCLRWTDEMFEEAPQTLFKKMISLEDACEWLKAHIKFETVTYSDVWDMSVVNILATDFTTVDEMEESFRKAMEGKRI